MSLSPPIQIWFVCKECKGKYQQLAEFLEHKTNEHFNEFHKTTCIVFEESNNPFEQFVEPIMQRKIKEEPHSNLDDAVDFHVTDYVAMDDADENSPADFVFGGNLTSNSSNIIPDSHLGGTEIINMATIKPEEGEIDQDPLACNFKIEVKPELNKYEAQEIPEEIPGTKPAIIIISPDNPYVLLTRLTAQEIRNSTQIQHECKLCVKKLNSEPELKIHVGICSLYHENRHRFCIPCNSMFANSSNLKRHDSQIHSLSDEEETWSSDSEDEESVTRVKKKANKKPTKKKKSNRNSGPYTCDICDTSFSRSYNLGVHRRIHSGERPYSCPVSDCDKTCTTKSNLKMHMAFHANLRPYRCPYSKCDKSFNFRSNLKEHKAVCSFK